MMYTKSWAYLAVGGSALCAGTVAQGSVVLGGEFSFTRADAAVDVDPSNRNWNVSTGSGDFSTGPVSVSESNGVSSGTATSSASQDTEMSFVGSHATFTVSLAASSVTEAVGSVTFGGMFFGAPRETFGSSLREIVFTLDWDYDYVLSAVSTGTASTRYAEIDGITAEFANGSASGTLGPGTCTFRTFDRAYPNASGTIFSTLTLTAVPEPGALGAIALGAMGLMHRRRA